VVHPGDAEATTDPATITSVTVTLDGSATSEEALPHAARLAAALAVPLRLFRVIPNLMSPSFADWGAGYAFYYPDMEELERDEEREVTEYLDVIAARLRASGLEVHTDWERSITGRGDDLIAAYLAQRPTGLAVMTSHGRGGVLRWALGSTTEAVLDRMPCPILIVQVGTTTTPGKETRPAQTLQPAD
jgi:nucleotide-binding universal stress UspA family protein